MEALSRAGIGRLTLVVDGEEGRVLVPRGRYGKMRNVWFIPSPATLAGWVNRHRDLGQLIFLDLRDRYGITQVVIDNAQVALVKADMGIARLYASLVTDETVRATIYSQIESAFHQTSGSVSRAPPEPVT